MAQSKQVIGYTPEPHQSAVHSILSEAKGTGKIVVVKSKRQTGKSMMAENELLRYAINYGGTTSAMISPTLNQSRKIFKELLNAIGSSGIVSKKNESLLTIDLINGSQIFFKSSAQKDSLRGYTISGILVIDEAAYLEDDVLELVLAWCNVHRAPILILSTPRLKQGFFYDYYMLGLSGKNEKVISIDWTEYDTSKFLDQSTLEMYRKIMPQAQFRSEFLGEFIENGGGVFNTSEKTWLDRVEGDWKELYVGIDFSNGEGGDYTVISGFNEKGEQVLLEYENKLKPLKVIGWLTNILQTYSDKIKKVICEKNSMGAVYIDMLKQKNQNINIVEFVTDNTSKREIIESMGAAIGEERLWLLNDKEQKVQFSGYHMEITKSGLVTYNGYLVHDDIVMADAFAWKAKKVDTLGTYTFSF